MGSYDSLPLSCSLFLLAESRLESKKLPLPHNSDSSSCKEWLQNMEQSQKWPALLAMWQEVLVGGMWFKRRSTGFGIKSTSLQILAHHTYSKSVSSSLELSRWQWQPWRTEGFICRKAGTLTPCVIWLNPFQNGSNFTLLSILSHTQKDSQKEPDLLGACDLRL
jgi:hypothetical protein